MTKTAPFPFKIVNNNQEKLDKNFNLASEIIIKQGEFPQYWSRTIAYEEYLDQNGDKTVNTNNSLAHIFMQQVK